MAALYMVFDVESMGLHGEGFAVGWVVVDDEGREYDADHYACDPEIWLPGENDDMRWVREHVRVGYNCDGLRLVKSLFWRVWRQWHDKGAVLVGDCSWPVEARFLLACIQDEMETRKWQGPYPLHDVATMRLAAGLDPLGTEERLPNELPQHNPLADARQSARLWLEALNAIKAKGMHG